MEKLLMVAAPEVTTYPCPSCGRKISLLPGEIGLCVCGWEAKRKLRTCKAPGCSVTFVPLSYDHYYHSSRCRSRDHKARKRTINKQKGKCPQCSREWIEPRMTHRGKPKHCLRCQVYYAQRHNV